MDLFINRRKHLVETAWAIAIALLLRSTVITLYKIPTGSMIPTFKIGDMLIANRFFYGLKIPFTDGLEGFRLPRMKRPGVGDIIIFKAPPEETFYFLQCRPLTDTGAALLEQINNQSSFKRPVSTENNYTNYIFIGQERSWLSSALAAKATVFIAIHHSLFKEYKKSFTTASGKGNEISLDGNFYLTERDTGGGVYEKQKIAMTYHQHKYLGLSGALLSTPLAGVSILTTVFLNAPVYLPTYILTRLYQHYNRGKMSFITYYQKEKDFSLVTFLDDRKDYVKRVIADEGDTVEIHDKRVYINGVEALQSMQPEQDKNIYGSVIAEIYTETLPGKKPIVHPVRFRDFKRSIQPGREFDAGLWPYDPFLGGGQYRDNFGPVTVPAGHYFAMGDNRDESLDCRFFGCVPAWAIKGTPMVKIWPPSRIGLIK